MAMTDLLMVYITAEDVAEAKEVGRHLLEKRLAACINIFPNMEPMFWWPPKAGKIDESKEVVLIAKTVEAKYRELEAEVHKIHSFDTPCVIAIPVKHVAKKYYDWLVSELEG
jgi:periplasmic divalent cation tolerance protein